MNISKKQLDVLKEGASDSMNLMDADAMDMIEGGAEWCLFCNKQANCIGKNEVSNPTDPPTDPPTPTPEPPPIIEPPLL